MSTVHHPPGAIGTAPPIGPPTIDLSNPEAAKRWAAVLREQIDDAVTAGLDATEPPGRRLLGRFSARENIVIAAECIESLFAAAGLSADGTPPGTRARTRRRASTATKHEGAASCEHTAPAKVDRE